MWHRYSSIILSNLSCFMWCVMLTVTEDKQLWRLSLSTHGRGERGTAEGGENAHTKFVNKQNVLGTESQTHNRRRCQQKINYSFVWIIIVDSVRVVTHTRAESGARLLCSFAWIRYTHFNEFIVKNNCSRTWYAPLEYFINAICMSLTKNIKCTILGNTYRVSEHEIWRGRDG